MIELEAVRASFPEIADLQPLSSGGQKEVLRGVRDGSAVVLKLIRPDGEGRVLREIEAVSALSCDYVPKVLDYGTREIGGQPCPYLVEQFVEGETYREVLSRVPRPPLGDVLDLGEALLRACCDFEARHLVHRDIKPENLMIGADGRVWLIDFGIVRFLDRTSLTPTANHFGPSTIGYSAPEQMRNLKTRVDGRCDLFSVGVVLYESLNGSNPYLEGKRDQIQVMNHVASQDLAPLVITGDSNGELSEFVSALCSRFQSRRPSSAADALDWLLSLRGGANSHEKG